MNNSKISIIIRTREEERHIGYAIQSCIDNFDNPEIIVIDDNSEDQTLKIVSLFDKHDIKVYNIEKKYSPGYSINLGVSKCSNELILVLSAHCQIIKMDLGKVRTYLHKYKAVFGNQTPIYHGKKITKSSNNISVYDPSTGEEISKVAMSGIEDFNDVIKSSKNSQVEWSNTTPLKRSRVISKYKTLIEKNLHEIAELICKEHGKTLDDAKGSVTRGLEVVEFACGIPHLLKGEFSQNVGTNIDSWSVRQPLGICAGITPFNFPAMVPMWMYPISIACGNSFILKPSEKDPSCSIKLAELFSEAGLPDGVLNVIQGDKTIVDLIIKSPEISSVSFVGSTPVAKYIYEESAKNLKRVQSLGGAKNHLIVMPDANIDQAVDGIMGAAYGSAGERCMAVSVAVAVGDVADDLVDKIHNQTQKLKIAPWTNSDSDMGPVISKEHKDKIIDYIKVESKKYFSGLPSPAAATLLASFIWISFDNGISGNEIFLGFFQMQWFALIITVFVALSMTANVNFYSGKDINLRNSQPFVVILLIALLFGLISHNPAEVIFIIALGYSLSGYFNLIRAKFKTSKNFLDVDIFDEK